MSGSGPPEFKRPEGASGAGAGPAYVAPQVQDTSPSLLVRSGANSVFVGLFAGLFGGTVGALITWAVAADSDRGTRLLLLAVIVPTLVGGLLSGWFDLTAKAWQRGLTRTATGAAVGCAAGLVGFGLADLVFGAVEDTSRNFGLVIGWIIVSALIGFGIGLYRSIDKAMMGLVSGTFGGVVGGLALVAVDVNEETGFGGVFIGVSIAALAVGLAIGGIERFTRNSWLEVLDGPLAGREFPLDGQTLLIGSAPQCQISMGIDPQVEPMHAQLAAVDDDIYIEPVGGVVRLDGAHLTGSARLLDQHISIGTSHLVLRRSD